MAVGEKHLAVKRTCLATQGGWSPPCRRHWHARGRLLCTLLGDDILAFIRPFLQMQIEKSENQISTSKDQQCVGDR